MIGKIGAVTGSRIDKLGMGTAPIGNLYAEVDEAEAQATLQKAWQSGIRYFDSAPFYGHGLAERRLGRMLSSCPRDAYAVSTKVGRRIETDTTAQAGIHDGFAVHGTRAVFDYSADGIRQSLADSLDRLGLDHIDIAYLHDIGRLTHGDRHPQVFRQALEEALPTMAALRESGVIGAIGVGVNEVEVCMELMPRFDLDYIMLAGRYTLFEQQSALDLLQAAKTHGVRIVIAGPYNSGLLSDPNGPGNTYDYALADDKVMARARDIYTHCENIDVGAPALQLPLAHPAVAAVVAGMRSVSEVESSIERMSQPLPNALWERLRKAGIIAPGVPVPEQEKQP